MDSASHPGRSWLAGLLLVLLAICAAALLKSFWAAMQPEPVPPSTVTESDDDHLPTYGVDESLQVLADPDAPSLDRTAAMKAVARDKAGTLPRIIELLDSPSVDVRLSAINLLGEWQQDAKAAAPRLQELCADPDPQIRVASVRAVLKVSPNPEDLRETLQATLDRGPEPAARAALDGLLELDPPPTIEELQQLATAGQYPSIKGGALGRLNTLALQDQTLLRSLLKDGLLHPRPEMAPALETLVRDEADDELHLAALIQLLWTPSAGSTVTSNARARKSFPEIVAATERHRDAPGCEKLIPFLAQSEAKSLPALRALLKSSQHATRCEAAASVAKFGTAEEALPVLLECLKSDAPGTEHAVYGLQWLGDDARVAEPALRELAKNSTAAGLAARRRLKEWGIEVPEPATVDP
jgi:HEAT repeat protein